MKRTATQLDQVSRTAKSRLSFPDYPNPRAFTIDPALMSAKFPGQFFALKDTPEYKALSGDIFSICKYDRRFIPQDDKRWMDLRGMPGVTGSVSAELLGFHDKLAGQFLDIPPSMYVTAPTNGKWQEYIEKAKYGFLPGRPMDPPGNVHCAYGDHEENVLATLMDRLKPMKLRQIGMVVIESSDLKVFRPVNVFTGKEITELPFEMRISGDFDAEIPDSVFEDDDGNMVYGGGTLHVAGECKTPTVYGMIDKVPKSDPGRELLLGAEYFFKRGGSKPYDHPKEYYIPQTFLEMLALGRHQNLFCAWSYSNGMNTWLIDMNIRYLSLILSVLIHLHDTFVVKGESVPTDYFMKHPDENMRKIYMELLSLTKTIATSAPIYMRVSGEHTRRVTEEYGVTGGRKAYVSFPNLPEDVIPTHQLLFAYGRRMLTDCSRLKWTPSWENLTERWENLCTLTEDRYTGFAREMVFEIMSNPSLRMVGINKDIDGGDIPVVRNKVLCLAEEYVLKVMKKLHLCYACPVFPKEKTLQEQELENDTIEQSQGSSSSAPPVVTTLSAGTFFYTVILECCAAYDDLKDALDGVGTEIEEEETGDKGGDNSRWREIDTFEPMQNLHVFEDSWTDQMCQMCRRLVVTKTESDKEIAPHLELLKRKDIFPCGGSTSKPQQWQYARLLAILVTVDIAKALAKI